MRIEYDALRELVPGHQADEIVMIPRDILPYGSQKGARNKALDGSAYTENTYAEKGWDIDTGWLDVVAEWPIFQEFLWSVSQGEHFILDPYSEQAGVAVDPRQCYLDARRFKPKRENPGNVSYQIKLVEV